MQFIITRKNFNTIELGAMGCYSKKLSYDEAFADLFSYISYPAYVNDCYLKDHTLYMEKLDSKYGFLFTDSYLLDGLLESDVRFMEQLNRLIREFQSVKEERQKNISEKINRMRLDEKATSMASRIFINYCETGQVLDIETPELAKKIIELYRTQDRNIYVGTYATLDDEEYEKPYKKFKTPQIRGLNIATGTLALATGALVITFTVTSSSVLLIGGVVTGCGAYLTNAKKTDINLEEAKKVLGEILKVLETRYNPLDQDVMKLTKINSKVTEQ